MSNVSVLKGTTNDNVNHRAEKMMMLMEKDDVDSRDATRVTLRQGEYHTVLHRQSNLQTIARYAKRKYTLLSIEIIAHVS